MPQQPAWDSLPAELWQRVISTAAKELYQLDLAGPFDVEEDACLLPWLRLVASLGVVSHSLRDALPSLGWDNISLYSSYTTLDKQASGSLNRCASCTPQRHLRSALALPCMQSVSDAPPPCIVAVADGMMRSEPCTWLRRWLAARAHSAWNIHISVDGWDEAELSGVMATLGQSSALLALYLMNDAKQAACCNAALATSSLECLLYHGSQPCVFPETLNELGLRQWLPTGFQWALHRSTKPLSPMLAKLQPLPKLETLTMNCFGWTLAEQDVQRLADCLPSLGFLHVRLILSPTARFESNLRTLADLLPDVELELTVHIFPSELRALAVQLQGVSLTALDLRCLHGAFEEDDEALLAGCKIEQLTVHFAGPRTRLAHVPPGAQVSYCLVDPDITAAALSVEWPLSLSEDD